MTEKIKKKEFDLKTAYKKLYRRFGPQNWWPGDTPFEIALGAILTQNTNWSNVEKAISNLKSKGVLSPRKLSTVPEKKLASIIRPSGYFNVKAKRLRAFLTFLNNKYRGSLKLLFKLELNDLREELLSINGIGEETADSIVLYAACKPSFVVDAYTRRVLSRHGMCDMNAKYAEIKIIFESQLKPDAKFFNEYHALIVRLGKEYCKARTPVCIDCPLED